MKNVVLFGGTFDPPHIGHLLMAELALEQSGCDEVWILPSKAPPHKLNHSVTPYPVRKEMARQLIMHSPGITLCDIEEDREEPSYTVDTVRILNAKYPHIRFWFLIGSDSLRDLPTWHRCEELVRQIEFLVAARSEAPFEQTYVDVQRVLPNLRAKPLQMPMLDVSSSFIRQRFDSGKPLCGLVPEAVLDVWLQYVDS